MRRREFITLLDGCVAARGVGAAACDAGGCNPIGINVTQIQYK
jgi:hypothetical protein